ncbi:hypothetical protein HDU97_001090 [Phlyctochytrium planicorne]|nr:hypothetical protein HDU97_001090 [Phlyctochytrium planicorne]
MSSRRQSIRFMAQPIHEEEESNNTSSGNFGNSSGWNNHSSKRIQGISEETDGENSNSNSNSSDSDEYDETLFQKYQQSLDQPGSQSMRGSAMGQGGAMSRRSTAGTWTLRGGKESGNNTALAGYRGSIAAGQDGGWENSAMNRRASRSTTTSTTGNGRRASFVANMSLVPIALRRLRSLENDSSTNVTAGTSSSKLPDTSGQSLENYPQGRRTSKVTGKNATFASAVGLGTGAGGEKGDDDDSGEVLDEITMALKRTEAIAERRKSAIQQMKAEAKAMVFKRKRIFLELSLIFGVSLTAIVIYEYYTILILEKVPLTAYWLLSILVLHVWGFYLFILAFVYANEAEDRTKIVLSLFCGALNLVSFLLRCVLVYMYYDLIPDKVEENFLM